MAFKDIVFVLIVLAFLGALVGVFGEDSSSTTDSTGRLRVLSPLE